MNDEQNIESAMFYYNALILRSFDLLDNDLIYVCHSFNVNEMHYY